MTDLRNISYHHSMLANIGATFGSFFSNIDINADQRVLFKNIRGPVNLTINNISNGEHFTLGAESKFAGRVSQPITFTNDIVWVYDTLTKAPPNNTMVYWIDFYMDHDTLYGIFQDPEKSKLVTTAEAIAGSETSPRSWSPKFVKDSAVYHSTKEYALGTGTMTVSDRDPVIYVAVNGSGGTLSLSSISAAHNSETTIEIHNASEHNDRTLNWSGAAGFSHRWTGTAVESLAPDERRIVKMIKTGTTFRLVDITAHADLSDDDKTKLNEIQAKATVGMVAVSRKTLEVVTTLGTTASTIRHASGNDTTTLEMIVPNTELLNTEIQRNIFEALIIDIYNEQSDDEFGYEAEFRVDSYTTETEGLTNNTKITFTGAIIDQNSATFSLGTVGNDTRLHFFVREDYGVVLPTIADQHKGIFYNHDNLPKIRRPNMSDLENLDAEGREFIDVGQVAYDDHTNSPGPTHVINGNKHLHDYTLSLGDPVFTVNIDNGETARLVLKYSGERRTLIWPFGLKWMWGMVPGKGPTASSGDYTIFLWKVNGQVRGLFLDPDRMKDIGTAKMFQHFILGVPTERGQVRIYQNQLFVYTSDDNGTAIPPGNDNCVNITSPEMSDFGIAYNETPINFGLETAAGVAADTDDAAQEIDANIEETSLSQFPLNVIKRDDTDDNKFIAVVDGVTLKLDPGNLTAQLVTGGEPEARTLNIKLQYRKYDSDVPSTGSWITIGNETISIAAGVHLTDLTLAKTNAITINLDRNDTVELRWLVDTTIGSTPAFTLNHGQELSIPVKLSGASQDYHVLALGTGSNAGWLVSIVIDTTGTKTERRLLNMGTGFVAAPKVNGSSSTHASSYTPKPKEETHKVYTGLTGTFRLNNPDGSDIPIGTTFVVILKDNGTSRTINYGDSGDSGDGDYETGGAALITATTPGKKLTSVIVNDGDKYVVYQQEQA